MQLSSDAQIPDGLLAAMTLLNEKPRLGLRTSGNTLHPGFTATQSTTALRDSWSVASETRWMSLSCEFGACGSGFAVDPNQIEQHHVFAQELVDWFRTRGLGDLTNLTIPLTAAAHRLKSGLGVHTNDGGNWNRVWREFRARYPNATRQQIIDQAKKMLIEFGIGAEDTLPSLFIIVNPCVANPAQPMCQTGYNLTMPIDTITPQPVTAKGM
jgi:hypothetical protein